MVSSTRKTLEQVFAWTVFPVVFGGAVASTIAIMDMGVSPAFAFLGPLVLSFVVIGLLERVFPYCPDWNRSQGDIKVDTGHLIISGYVTVGALRPLAMVVAVAGAGWLSGTLGDDLWPNNWHLVAQLVLALVVGEFFMYWIHRLTHMYDWLWRFHALHHSAPRLYFLNSARFHPVDLALSAFAPLIPLVILGADEAAIALFTVATAVHGAFQHANLKIRCGPLNWFFSMAELHRWHHSRKPEESNTNFGQNLIVWDIVFGTREFPKDRQPPTNIGLTDLPSFPMNYVGQLTSPFQWARIKRESAAHGSS